MIVKIVDNSNGNVDLYEADKISLLPPFENIGPDNYKSLEREIVLNLGSSSFSRINLYHKINAVGELWIDRYQIYIMNDNGKTIEAIYW